MIKFDFVGSDIGKRSLSRRKARANLVLLRLRSYLGYPPIRDALPNTTHYALAALQHAGTLSRLITQVNHSLTIFHILR